MSRLTIADVISETVTLGPSKQPDVLKGRCPLCQSPDFRVHTAARFYHCLGCRKKGDVFDFVMETRHVTFAEALHLLGGRAGVEVLPPTSLLN